MNWEQDYSFLLLFLTGVLPLVFVGVAKAGSMKPAHNAEPRDFTARLTGFRKRAFAAQLNSYEGFPLFAAGIFVAHWQMTGTDYSQINTLAALYFGSRVLYGIAYVANQATLRSLLWFVGLVAAGTLYFV
jgi:uncharacterized MAPEG superfamily protein